MMSDIESLKKAIKSLHGCDADHVSSVPVHETFRGQVVWDGVVEVFDLKGHPKAKRCYAWSHLHGPKDEERRFVAVLEIPPVSSAETAVRASIVDQYRGRDTEGSDRD